MLLSPLTERLIRALRALPGVGPKSAQRMAFDLLLRHRENGLHLAEALSSAISQVKQCATCHMLCDQEICDLCQSNERDPSLLCVVTNPLDLIAFEQMAYFKGRYFVLKGHLSPLDGLGPEEIGIDKLLAHVKEGAIKEMILATNTTVEGEATAHFIASLLEDTPIICSRIAYGVPVGGELEYLDANTLKRAFTGRTKVSPI